MGGSVGVRFFMKNAFWRNGWHIWFRLWGFRTMTSALLFITVLLFRQWGSVNSVMHPTKNREKLLHVASWEHTSQLWSWTHVFWGSVQVSFLEICCDLSGRAWSTLKMSFFEVLLFGVLSLPEKNGWDFNPSPSSAFFFFSNLINLQSVMSLHQPLIFLFSLSLSNSFLVIFFLTLRPHSLFLSVLSSSLWYMWRGTVPVVVPVTLRVYVKIFVGVNSN